MNNKYVYERLRRGCEHNYAFERSNADLLPPRTVDFWSLRFGLLTSFSVLKILLCDLLLSVINFIDCIQIFVLILIPIFNSAPIRSFGQVTLFIHRNVCDVCTSKIVLDHDLWGVNVLHPRTVFFFFLFFFVLLSFLLQIFSLIKRINFNI